MGPVIDLRHAWQAVVDLGPSSVEEIDRAAEDAAALGFGLQAQILDECATVVDFGLKFGLWRATIAGEWST